MTGSDIYAEKTRVEKKVLRKEFDQLYPLPKAWKIILPVAFCFAIFGLVLQGIFLVTGRQYDWMMAAYFILYGTWVIVYSVYVFRVMLKRNEDFYNWIEKNQQR